MRLVRVLGTLVLVACPVTVGAQAPTTTVRVGDPSTYFPTKSPTGKPTPSVNDARNAMNKALLACRTSFAHTNPVAWPTMNADWKKAEESEWLDYFINRDWAEHLEAGISAWDGSFNPFDDVIPAHWIPKCNAYFDNYVKATGMTDLPLTKDCTNIVPVLMKMVKDKAAYFSAPQHAADHPNYVYPVRFALENLRSSMYAPYNQNGFARCATPDKLKKAFVPYKQEFDALETQLVAWETARGMRFVLSPWGPAGDPRASVSQRPTNYVDIKTNQPCRGACLK